MVVITLRRTEVLETLFRLLSREEFKKEKNSENLWHSPGLCLTVSFLKNFKLVGNIANNIRLQRIPFEIRE